MSEKKKNIWWYIKEGLIFAGASLLTFAPEVVQGLTKLDVLKDYTMVSQAALPAAVLWRTLKIRKNYMQNTLPNFITKLMDKVPDKVTGEKSTKLPSGLSDVSKKIIDRNDKNSYGKSNKY